MFKCLKEKKLLQKFAATLKKFSAQGAKKVEYSMLICASILMGVSSLRKEFAP